MPRNATTSSEVPVTGPVIATLPMIVVFMIFQRKLIQGISMSGLEG